MSNNISRQCPALGIACYNSWCLENKMCISQKGYTVDKNGASHAVQEEGPGMECPMTRDGIKITCLDPGCLKEKRCLDQLYAYNTDKSWSCPKDGQKCELFSCNGGQSCFAQTGTTGIVHHSSGQAHYRKAVPLCHEGMISVGFINKAEIMLGREISAKLWNEKRDGPLAMAFGLLGDPFPQGSLIGMNQEAESDGLKNLLVSTKIVPNVWVKWPDYGVVPLDKNWWVKLLGYIAGLDGAVLIYCWGGHGRTGTAGAIIAALSGLCPEPGDPVGWLRSKYCKSAVESEEQIKYIEEITGRKVYCDGAKVYSVFTTKTKGSKKNSHSTSSKSGGKAPAPEGLSIKKWKRWWRRQPRTGMYRGIASVSRHHDLPDGQTFEIDGKIWKWKAKDNVFEEVRQDPQSGIGPEPK